MSQEQTGASGRGSSKPVGEGDLRGFSDVMRRLVRVPKSEVDAEDVKYRAMRERRKASRAARGKKPPKGG